VPRNGTRLSPASKERIPVGKFRATVDPLTGQFPTGYFLKSIMAGSTNLLTEPLEVTASGLPSIAITLGVSSPPPWLDVKGRIARIDNAKAPIREIVIEPFSDFFQLPKRTASVSPDGSFELPAVMVGSYKVHFGDASDGFNRRLQVYRSDGDVVDVVNVEVPAIPPVRNVRGRVSGIALTAERLSTFYVQLHLISDLVDSPALAISPVAPDGTFAFSALEARNYFVYLVECNSGDCSAIAQSGFRVIDSDVDDLVIDPRRR
jgi:hypothetical protein